MRCCRFYLGYLLTFLPVFVLQAASVHSYLPENELYQQAIIPPESVLGFDIGERHVRHDQLVNYFQVLAKSSSRMKLTELGQTNEFRKQFLVTISAEKNLANLDNILSQRSYKKFLKQGKASKQKSTEQPLVIWLGYSVHGDEISGANAAMVVAYYLAASENEQISQLLENTIIVLEPSMNPDGMDRFVNWVNTFRGVTTNSNPDHIEHHQPWRTGRTNHFGFDLNRDWLLVSQQETINRLPYFYQYQPNVVGDFHEMSANSSYFFQPGIPSRNNPLTPKDNIELTKTLATFHGEALDQQQQLYFSHESYDDFYYGKGSTYPDITGAIGILFEQAGSKGMQQTTDNGVLTFAQGIQNHVTTSLSTINGAWQNQAQLKNYRHSFYQQVKKLADKEKFAGYLINEAQDEYRLKVLLEKLQQHQIDVYPLTADFNLNDTVYKHSQSYYVPLAQPQYRMIKALFSKPTEFTDNSFYDVSGWTMPLAMDIDVEEVESTWGLKLAKQVWQQLSPTTKAVAVERSAYAYAIEWHHYLAPKLLQSLLSNNIKVKVATKTFTSKVGQSNRAFSAGTLLIPAGIQQTQNWQKLLIEESQRTGIEVTAIASGLAVKGVDLGSNSLKLIKPVNVMLVGGKGISQYEAAEVLFYLDQQLNIPVTIVEKNRLSRIDLSSYSHVIFVDGNYNGFSESVLTNVEQWAKAGGVLIAQKRAAQWLADNGLLQAKFARNKEIAQMFDSEGLKYQDKEMLASRKRISGAIYQSQLDSSHPLSYGFNDASLPLFRNSTLIMDLPTQPFITVAKYSAAPLLSGYSDQNLVNRIADNAAVIAHNIGKGRVIATTDNLTFRGYWHGSARLMSNSLFFAHAFSARAE